MSMKHEGEKSLTVPAFRDLEREEVKRLKEDPFVKVVDLSRDTSEEEKQAGRQYDFAIDRLKRGSLKLPPGITIFAFFPTEEHPLITGDRELTKQQDLAARDTGQWVLRTKISDLKIVIALWNSSDTNNKPEVRAVRIAVIARNR